MSLRSCVLAFLAPLVLGAPCGAADDAPSRYRVTVDLTDSIRALASEESSTYDAAVQLLSGLGIALLPTLAEALHREPERVRAGIVEVLDQIGEPECVPLLIEAGSDKSLEVRVDALVALGSLADERARPMVEGSLDDGAEPVRRAAATACATLCRSSTALRRLTEMAVRDPSLGALFPARHSLGVLVGDEDAETAKAARQAVEEIARPAFEKAAGHQERVRAALLLADVGDAGAISWLRESLPAETDPALRIQVIATLGDAGDESALPVLVDQAKDATRRPVVCRAFDRLAARQIKGAAEAARSCRAALPPRKG